MKIEKRCFSNGRTVKKNHPTVRKQFTNLKLSAEVRDHILPFRYVMVSAEGNSLILKGSDNCNDYRLSIYRNGQASICCSYILRFADVPEKITLDALLLDDHIVRIALDSGDKHGI